VTLLTHFACNPSQLSADKVLRPLASTSCTNHEIYRLALAMAKSCPMRQNTIYNNYMLLNSAVNKFTTSRSLL